MSSEDRSRFDEDLSVLIDGELDAEREAELRAELERDPQLAARFEALSAVDVSLRATPARAVPDDLRARLQTRIDAAPSPANTPARGRIVTTAPRRRRWRAAPAVALVALAAAIVLVMLGRRPSESRPPEHVAEQPAPDAARAPTPGADRAPAPTPSGDATAVDLGDASDEELEIAMDWRLLDEDLEMIQQLELLEKMLAHDKGRG